jgi:hypothetical protein
MTAMAVPATLDRVAAGNFAGIWLARTALFSVKLIGQSRRGRRSGR